MFNDYIVTFWNHETREIETDRIETRNDLARKGFEAIPEPHELADDLYEIYGDTVGRITDLAGTVLLDRQGNLERAAGRHH